LARAQQRSALDHETRLPGGTRTSPLHYPTGQASLPAPRPAQRAYQTPAGDHLDVDETPFAWLAGCRGDEGCARFAGQQPAQVWWRNSAASHRASTPPGGSEPSGGSVSARADHLPAIWPRPSLGPADLVVLARHSAWPPRRVASHDPKTTKEGQHPIQVTECGTLPTLDMLDSTSPARPGSRRPSPEAEDENAGLGKRRLFGHVRLSPNNDQRSGRAGYPIVERLPCLSVSGFSITTTHNGDATSFQKTRGPG